MVKPFDSDKPYDDWREAIRVAATKVERAFGATCSEASFGEEDVVETLGRSPDKGDAVVLAYWTALFSVTDLIAW